MQKVPFLLLDLKSLDFYSLVSHNSDNKTTIMAYYKFKYIMKKNSQIKAQSDKFESFALGCFQNTFSRKLDNISVGTRIAYFFLGIIGIFADVYFLAGRVFLVPDSEK